MEKCYCNFTGEYCKGCIWYVNEPQWCLECCQNKEPCFFYDKYERGDDNG